MTTLIEGLLLDRLVREVERRKDAQAVTDTFAKMREDSVATISALEQTLRQLKDERDRIAMTRDRLIDEANDRRRRAAATEPFLYELWEAADDLRKELNLARVMNLARVRKDLAAPIKRLHDALRAAHDACGRIPF